MKRILFIRIAVIVLSLCASLPAIAQVVEPQKVDPEGVEFRNRLRALVQAEDMAGFKEAVGADRNLSQRAFVAEFLEIWNACPEGADLPDMSRLTGVLADEILTSCHDAKPAQVCLRYNEGKAEVAAYELARYAEDVYPPYVDTELLALMNFEELVEGVDYGAGVLRRAEFDDDTFNALAPFYWNCLRSILAPAYQDATLTVQELELMPTALQLTFDRIRVGSPDADVLKNADERLKWRLVESKFGSELVLVNCGLKADLDPDMLRLLARADPESKVEVWLTRFQAAYRNSRLEEARAHLRAIEAIVSQSNAERPALFRFIIKTMRVQARADEDSLTEAAILDEFDSAWKELADYSPGMSVEVDRYWWVAKPALRYWIDKLSRFDQHGEGQRLRQIFLTLLEWHVKGYESPVLEHYTPHEAILEGRQVVQNLVQRLTVFDLMTFWLEKFGLAGTTDNASRILPLLESTTSDFGRIPLEFDLNLETLPYPTISFEDSTLMRELKLRNAYIRAKFESQTPKQLTTALQPLIPTLESLDRPESYIHYRQLLAKEFEASGRPDLALPLLEKAIDHADKYSFRKNEIELATTLARLYSAQGDWERALLYSNRAQSLLQAALPNSTTGEATELGKYSRSAGELSAMAHLKSDAPQAAFEALSQGQQMESAATQLAVNRTVRGDQNDLAAKQQSVEAQERQVKVVESLPPSQTRTELLESNEKRLAATRAEFMTESRKIRAKYPKLYSSTLRLDPLSLPDVQASLPAGTAVVQYFPTAEELYVFVVTGTSFRLHSVAVKQAELDSLVLDYLKKMRMLSSVRGPLGTLSQKLDGLLIEPIAEDVAGSETLLLIPSGSLNVLPFASLADPSGQPLIARKRVVSLAKATDFMKIAASQPRKVGGLVAFANATLDLPSAQHEGETIKGIFPDSKLFVGTEASRDNLLKFAPGADALHLATHGISDSADSLNNYLALAGNGRLTQEEIFNLDLGDTTLVTLSACNTALSDSTEYEFVASIAEAFWIAGSRSVVASLWAVDDDSTEKLMTGFYRGMKEQGLGKAEALQRAQLAVRSQPRFEHPYYWSGFMLFGDYR